MRPARRPMRSACGATRPACGATRPACGPTAPSLPRPHGPQPAAPRPPGRVIKSLEPYPKKLGTDTWFYAKRTFLALAETLAKHMIMLKVRPPLSPAAAP